MIWLDYFLQLLCNAVAWSLAVVIGVLVFIAVAKAYAGFTGWLWRRSQSRGIQRRFGARG
jgi:hypothetical protein